MIALPPTEGGEVAPARLFRGHIHPLLSAAGTGLVMRSGVWLYRAGGALGEFIFHSECG